jgi:hypothetical protein
MSSRLMMIGSRATLTAWFTVAWRETLNALLDAEGDRPCDAQRYERSEAHRVAIEVNIGILILN